MLSKMREWAKEPEDKNYTLVNIGNIDLQSNANLLTGFAHGNAVVRV